MLDPEILKALALVEEFDKTRRQIIKEFRLYYANDGTIIGLWESDFPEGQYIVLDELALGLFNSKNTLHLKVINKTLKYIDPTIPPELKIIRSTKGQPTVKGHAGLALIPNEEYQDIVYYDRNN